MSFECSNPDCTKAFDYRRGRLFRFHNNRPDAETPAGRRLLRKAFLALRRVFSNPRA